jgi:hypothetical protein
MKAFFSEEKKQKTFVSWAGANTLALSMPTGRAVPMVAPASKAGMLAVNVLQRLPLAFACC